MTNMMITTIECKFDEDFLKDLRLYPAVSDHAAGKDVYFIKDNEIVGQGHIGSSNGMGEVTIYYDEENMPFFKDDSAVKRLGKHAGFRFFQYDGTPNVTYTDEAEDRCEGYTIVSKFDFDWGIASTKRYGHIPGFGNAPVISKLKS
jgi:hypothetical protein